MSSGLSTKSTNQEVIVAPMWDAVEFWEGDLMNYFSHNSIYRGPPTLEREQAWFDLWHRQSLLLQRGTMLLAPGSIYSTSLLTSDPISQTRAYP